MFLCYTRYGDGMEKKTHLVCANMIAIYMMRPDSISSLLITSCFASLGGLLPDVDLKDSTSDKLFDRLMTSLITIFIMSFFLRYFFNFDFFEKVREFDNILSYLIGVCVFIVIGYFGSKFSHRSFTHSILGCFVYSFVLFYSFGGFILVPFLCGFVSHIVLDLFNKKGIALLYPCKFRFCFNLCDSNGKVNKFLFVLFSFLIVVLLGFIGFDVSF